MRLPFLRYATVFAAVVAGPLEAAPAAGQGRMVEIISMGGAPAPPPRDVEQGSDSDTGATDGQLAAPSLSTAFRTHDLSRRWVEFEMSNSFSSLGSSVHSDDGAAEDPFARVGVANLTADAEPGALGPPPIVRVPAWMRAGTALAVAPTSFSPGCGASAYRPSGFLSADAEGRRLGYYAMMSSIACEYGVPVGLFDALIIRESRYRADIFSPKNAFGLTQLMPDTAVGLGVNRYVIEENLRGGASYLRQQLDRFGEVPLALAAYNAGPGRVRNGMLPRIAETQAYVDNVLLNWQRLAGLAGEKSSVSALPRSGRSGGRVATVSAF